MTHLETWVQKWQAGRYSSENGSKISTRCIEDKRMSKELRTNPLMIPDAITQVVNRINRLRYIGHLVCLQKYSLTVCCNKITLSCKEI